MSYRFPSKEEIEQHIDDLPEDVRHTMKEVAPMEFFEKITPEDLFWYIVGLMFFYWLFNG